MQSVNESNFTAKSNAVAGEINQSGGKAVSIPGDVLNKDYIEQLVKKAADFGDGEIHILVNNAGYTWDGVIHKTTDEQWDAILAMHTKAPFTLVRECSKYFRVVDGEDRCIVNVGSTSGVFGNAGQANYATAKAGVEGLTKTIAKVCTRASYVLSLSGRGSYVLSLSGPVSCCNSSPTNIQPLPIPQFWSIYSLPPSYLGMGP